jgi:hypothetical protein
MVCSPHPSPELLQSEFGRAREQIGLRSEITGETASADSWVKRWDRIGNAIEIGIDCRVLSVVQLRCRWHFSKLCLVLSTSIASTPRRGYYHPTRDDSRFIVESARYVSRIINP